jgi:hypothetical protein
MSNIIQFKEYKRRADHGSYPVIKKLVDGEVIECIDFDGLTPNQRSQLLSSKKSEEH